jgi:protocatechuate 3,4-dioxygenase beta subunit
MWKRSVLRIYVHSDNLPYMQLGVAASRQAAQVSRVLDCLVALLLVSSWMSGQAISGGDATAFVQGGLYRNPTRDTGPATGRSTIRGRIVAADNEQPVRRAMVRVSSREHGASRTTLTDADGRYEFHELAAGHYSINTSKSAFVTWFYGETRPASSGRLVVLAENQTADHIDVRLPRGAVITGRVTDDYGDPVPNAMVTPLRQQFSQGQRHMVAAGARATTNDIGEYRIFGLTPGQYYVSASESPALATLEGTEARSGHAPTFYPGTTDVASASKLAVTAAQTVSDINIVLLRTPLATIRGVAADSRGRPLTAGNITITRREGMIGTGFSGGGQVFADGTFTIPNVAPGTYLLRASATRAPSGLSIERSEDSVAVVTVNGEDLADVQLTPVVPVTVSGRVTFDDQAASKSLKPSEIRIASQTLNADAMALAGSLLPLQADFTFTLQAAQDPIALNASYFFSLSTTPTAGGWRVKAVRVNAADVTDTGVDVSSHSVSGVEIELTDRLQQISGTVVDGSGNARKDYAVVVFAQEPARRIVPFNRYFAIGHPGNDGRFNIGTLPPGDYCAIALDWADPAESQDPEFLETLSRQAVTFSLAQGETRTLDLRLVTLQ